MISRERIYVDPAKVEAMVDWKQLETPTEIRSFLGLVDYYIRFIKAFSRLAGPLTRLIEKHVPFAWSAKYENSFKELKHHLTTACSCIYTSYGREMLFILYRCFQRRFRTSTDARKKSGCICFKKTQKTWVKLPKHDLELGTIVFALKKLEALFIFALEIFTDHKSLCHIFS